MSHKVNKIYLPLNTNKLQVITGHQPFLAVLHSVNLDPFIYRRIGGLKNHTWGEGSRFSCKNGDNSFRGWGILYKRGKGGEGGKHYFLLVMYGFCSNNVLYSASVWYDSVILSKNIFKSEGVGGPYRDVYRRWGFQTFCTLFIMSS